jgi:hypothetical protein
MKGNLLLGEVSPSPTDTDEDGVAIGPARGRKRPADIVNSHRREAEPSAAIRGSAEPPSPERAGSTRQHAHSEATLRPQDASEHVTPCGREQLRVSRC